MFEMRSMQTKDSSAVLDIFKQGIEDGNATFDQEVPSWEEWDRNHIPNCRIVIEDVENKVIAWGALKPTSNRECFSGVAEVSIYVARNFQGKGLGKMLMRRLILESEEKGFWTLQSGIFPENIASVELHKKMGFRVVGTRERIGKMNGIWRDIILMEKRSEQIL